MPKILITGAKGQLGNKIIEILGKENELILTDVDNMDITDLGEVEDTIKANKPEFIIHTAAYTKVDAAEENVDLCRKINAVGTKNIALTAQNYNIPLIYISTDFVFDGKKKTPYLETDTANPLSVYGLTKYEGEQFVSEICGQYYILRTAWVFGELPENHPGTNFVETMLRLSKEKELLTIVDDQVGSPTYTGDLVLAIEQLIKQKPANGIYHFSGDGACSWYDFAKEIFGQSNVKIEVKPVTSAEFIQKAQRPAYSYLCKSKIEQALNIKVRPWQEMLSEYLKNR